VYKSHAFNPLKPSG